MIDPTIAAPSARPTATVELQGVTYTLRFSALTEYVLDDLGIDINQFLQGARQSKSGKWATFVKIFSAMVAYAFVSRHEPYPPPEHWAAVIDADPATSGEKAKEICQAVTDVLLGELAASAQTAKLREPAPARSQGLQ